MVATKKLFQCSNGPGPNTTNPRVLLCHIQPTVRHASSHVLAAVGSLELSHNTSLGMHCQGEPLDTATPLSHRTENGTTLCSTGQNGTPLFPTEQNRTLTCWGVRLKVSPLRSVGTKLMLPAAAAGVTNIATGVRPAWQCIQ
jgi:hypothetical protein